MNGDTDCGEKEENLFLSALQLATASTVTAAIRAALELGLFDIMTDAGDCEYLSPSEIASRIVPPANNPDAPAILERVMGLLASYSIVTCLSRDLPDGKVERLYGAGALSKFFVNKDDGVSQAARFFLTNDKVFLENWYHLKDAIVGGGIPFEMAHNGMTLYQYCGIDSRFNKVFNRSMSNNSIFAMKKVLQAYKGFEGLNSLVDVGGGNGTCISMVVSNYPLIKAINFDLPHVVADAPPHPGVEHVGGDMFERIPKADAIFMKMICHNWDDECCLKLLNNCYDALPQNGKVIIADQVIPEAPVTGNSLAMRPVVHGDLRMYVHLSNGKERTAKEFEALAKASGFHGFRVICSAFEYHVMEFLKGET